MFLLTSLFLFGFISQAHCFGGGWGGYGISGNGVFGKGGGKGYGGYGGYGGLGGYGGYGGYGGGWGGGMGGGWGGGWGGGFWSPYGPGALGYWGQGRSRNLQYNPYFANSQMKPYKGDTTYTKEKPKVVKVVQPVVKYVVVDKKVEQYDEPTYYNPKYDVEYLKPKYEEPKYSYSGAKHRKKRGILLPKKLKTKYNMRQLSSRRPSAYWNYNPGWGLSPHYYYSKSAYSNYLRKKFFNRKLKFSYDDYNRSVDKNLGWGYDDTVLRYKGWNSGYEATPVAGT